MNASASFTKALDFGINFIDTADRYSRGESEEVVGKALNGRRDNVVLATKVHGPMGEDPNQQGNSRRWTIMAVEDSLRRLQTDHIELYQIHRPSPETDIEETLSAFTDLMRAGKVRAIGSSTVSTKWYPPGTDAGPKGAVYAPSGRWPRRCLTYARRENLRVAPIGTMKNCSSVTPLALRAASSS